MLNKKFMILTIILISLLSVSVASAVDNATSDIVSVEETTDEVVMVSDDVNDYCCTTDSLQKFDDEEILSTYNNSDEFKKINVHYQDFDLEVNQNDSEFELNVTVDDALIGDHYTYVKIDLPENHQYYDDMITIIVDNDVSNAFKTDDDEFYMPIENLTLGTHTVEVICEADDYFKKSIGHATFNIGYINVYVEKDYEYGNNIYVRLTENVGGYLLMYVDGKLNSVIFLDDYCYDVFYLNFDNFSIGKHDYEFRYVGDENYPSYSKIGTVNIDYSMGVSKNYLYYGENLLDAYINEYATGNLILTLDGENYTSNIEEGKAIFKIPPLIEGIYPITITYPGNEKLDSKTIQDILEISYEIQIEDEYINLTLPQNASGNLIAYLFDNEDDYYNYDHHLIYEVPFEGNIFREYNITLSQGNAQVLFSDLDDGLYYIIALYDGEDYWLDDYSSSIYKTSLESIQVDYPEDITLNQEAYINITLGERRDKSLLNVKIIEGYDEIVLDVNAEDKIKIPTSKIGNYHIEITYGDEMWDGYYFDILPLKLNIPERFGDVKLGEVISVEMPEDAKGKIIWDFHGYAIAGPLLKQIISNETTNGKVSMVLNNLSSKNYASMFNYVDEVYGNYSTYLRINVIGYETECIITSSNGPDSTIVNVSFSDDAEGEIVFIFSDELYYSKVHEGSTNVELPKLSEGNYNYTIMYSGDTKYKSFTASGSLKVNNATVNPSDNTTKTSLIIDDVNTTWNQETTFTANVMSENKTINEGIVSFYIDDNFIGDASVINGTATLIHEAPGDAGNHVISAIYNCGNYLSFNNTSKMFVGTGDIEVEDYNSIATFKALANLIENTPDGGVLNLTKNYIFPQQSINYQEIVISKSLTIDGNGHYIDGNNFSKIFFIPCYNVTLKNINFINAYSGDAGSAIYWNGENGTLINCSFYNCICQPYSLQYGNTIVWYGENGNILDCNFSSNVDPIYDWERCRGTIFFQAKNCSVINCYFENPNFENIMEYNEIYSTDYTFIPVPDYDVFISKKNSMIIVSNYTFNYEDFKNISIMLVDLDNHNPIINQNVHIKVNSVYYSLFTNDKGILILSDELTNLNTGVFNVTVDYYEDDNYNSNNVTFYITINPSDILLNFNNTNGTVGHDLTISVNVISPNNLTINEGIVTFYDGEAYIGEANVYDSVATLTYTPTTAGNHTIVAFYTSENYQSVNSSAVLSVAKANVDLGIDNIESVYFTNPSNFAVNVNSNNNPVNEGEIKFYVNDVLVGSSNIYNGEANFNYATNTTGSFTLTVVFNETENYLAANTTSYFNVNQMPTTLSGESIIFDEQAYKTFTTELKDNNDNGVNEQPVKIEVIKYSGESATFNGMSDANGITIYDVGKLAGGMWYVTGIYTGDQNYIGSSFADKFIVVRMDTTTDIEEIDNPQVNHSYKLKANIHDENGKLVKEGIVQFYLDGVDIGSIDLSNNQGHQDALGKDVLGAVNPMLEYNLGADDTSDLYLNYVPTKTGKHTLTAVYEGTTIYKPSNQTTTFVVSEETVEPEIVIPPLDQPTSDGSIPVTLPSDATGTVTLTVNGKDYNFDVSNGKANVKLPELTNGDYQYTIAYSGDSKYSSFTSNGSLKVNKTSVNPVDNKTNNTGNNTSKENTTIVDNSNIVASNVKVIYATKSYYTIQVYGTDGKLANGASVIVTVNGEALNPLTTDSNGIAKFKVTQKPGTYKLSTTALDKTVNTTLKVKHLLKLKTVKVKKSAKKLVLTASLAKVNGKYLKKKTIKFKFNGKKYKAKTNKKGVAKVTIKSKVLKKLKVGKKVKYQAKYKETVTKKVKVKK